MERYNINNEEYKQYLEGLLLANLPIEFYGLKMRQMKVKEILELGEPIHNSMIKPFTINVDLIDNEQIKKNGFTTLDVIYAMNNDFLENAIKLIKIIFDLEDECVSTMFTPKPEIVITKNKHMVCINGDRFEELKHIVLKMFNTREINKEDMENSETKKFNFKDEETKANWEYFMKRRKKDKSNQKKNNQVKLYNVYNFISNCDGVNYEQALNLTIYQIFNSYNIRHIKDDVDYTMKIATSGMCSAEGLDLSPLSTRIVK